MRRFPLLRWSYTPIPKEGNPNWPLPSDYSDPGMTDEGRRLARVNACLMQHDPKLAVQSWLYFCQQYLMPDEEAGFDPGFYYPPVRPFGFIHPLIIEAIESHPRSAIGAPRGCAKTSTVQSYCLFKIMTQRLFRIRVYKSTEDGIMEDVRVIRDQIEANPRIISDFGDIVPGRNEGIWSHHYLRTKTGVMFAGRSIGAQRLRGGRFDLGILDDPEYDPDNPLQSDEAVRRLAHKLKVVIMPMFEPGQGHFCHLGTPIHAKSLLNTILASDAQMPDRDSAFSDKLWYKINIPAKYLREKSDGSTEVVRAWSKFSDAFLDDQRDVLGESGFGSEYGGQPRSAEETPFNLRPSEHEYTTDADMSVDLQTDPLRCEAPITYHECAGMRPLKLAKRTVRWCDLVQPMYRFLTVDYAYTANIRSDWSVIHVMGSDARGDLWSLDMGRWHCKFPQLVDKIWEWAIRWRVAAIGVEAYPVQEAYYEQVAAFGDQVVSKLGYVPQLIPIKPPIHKGTRILRLDYRFERGRLKLPAWRRYTQPYYALYEQIRLFTEDLGNLNHDDELDTLSMSCDVLHGSARGLRNEYLRGGPLDLLQRGELHDPDFGTPLIDCLPLTGEVGTILRKLMDDQRWQRYQDMREVAQRHPMEDVF